MDEYIEEIIEPEQELRICLSKDETIYLMVNKKNNKILIIKKQNNNKKISY